jgi:hypothetical protein
MKYYFKINDIKFLLFKANQDDLFWWREGRRAYSLALWVPSSPNIHFDISLWNLRI